MSDERIKKTSGGNRTSKAMQDRPVTEKREVTEDERLEMFRQQFFQSSLPDLPDIPGWHLCWITTTNPRDTVQHRIRLGYEPVKPEEIAGWEYATIKGGEWDGFIGVNEMLAFKLPMSLYEKYMMEAHHDAPMREELKLAETAALIEEQAQASGGKVEKGDGTAEIGQYREAPHFDLS